MDVDLVNVRTTSQDVVLKVETIFQTVVGALLQKQDRISISILAKRNLIPPRRIILNFPGGSPQESWRFGNQFQLKN